MKLRRAYHQSINQSINQSRHSSSIAPNKQLLFFCGFHVEALYWPTSGKKEENRMPTAGFVWHHHHHHHHHHHLRLIKSCQVQLMQYIK